VLRPRDHEVLLTPAEVAALFRVDPKTVTRWAKAGKLTAIRTLGGHRRYRQSEVQALLKTVPGSIQPTSATQSAPTSIISAQVAPVREF
jgi:excisionase family DNA binding protein